MKKAVISISFDEEKLSAAGLYMAQKELSFENEMEKAAEGLYGKYVPANVREYLELREKEKPTARPRKPRPSSAVGAPVLPGGDSD